VTAANVDHNMCRCGAFLDPPGVEGAPGVVSRLGLLDLQTELA
jgi:hypothetical protein